MSDMSDIGNVIRGRRTELKLSQRQLAKLIGVQPTTISRWETGQGYPDQGTISKIALELGVTADYLYGTSGTTKNKKKSKPSWIKMFLIWSVVILFVVFFIFVLLDRYSLMGKIRLSYISIYHNYFIDIILFAFLLLMDLIFVSFKHVRRKVVRFFYNFKYKDHNVDDSQLELSTRYIIFVALILLFLASIPLLMLIK